MDFGGLAKGYAADRVSEIFGEWKISSALINLGRSSIVSTTGERDWPSGIALNGLRSAVAITRSALLGEVVSKHLLLEEAYRGGAHEYLRLLGSQEAPTEMETNLRDTVMFTHEKEVES
jgi:ApbE family protein